MKQRSEIKSGDLLIWSNDKFSSKSNFYLNGIRTFTRSEYAHTATAWNVEGRLMIVEATQPVVRLNPVRDHDEFFHIAMPVEWTVDSEEFLISVIGCPYSFMDAVRAYLNMTVDKDNRYQCAELCKEFYLRHGIDLGEVLTPAAIVRRALEVTGQSLTLFPALADRPKLKMY